MARTTAHSDSYTRVPEEVGNAEERTKKCMHDSIHIREQHKSTLRYKLNAEQFNTENRIVAQIMTKNNLFVQLRTSSDIYCSLKTSNTNSSLHLIVVVYTVELGV